MTTILQFSGGADSLATLFLKRPQWDDITVVWLDTGAAYEDTHKLMERMHKLLPYFRVLRSDKRSWERINGVAVDVVPERYTLLGHLIHSSAPSPLYVSYLQCCAANIWKPMDDYVKLVGATTVIRGQRAEEKKKAPVRNGQVVDGVRYEFPIEDWTRQEVIDYCKEVCPDLLPSYYDQGEDSSHDCWDCIAYLEDNRNRIRNLRGDMAEVVAQRLIDYRAAMKPDQEYRDGIL